MRPLTPKFPKLLHGGDYNPEQWLRYPEILKQDVELMKKADINCVSVGIFSWAHLEPNEGEYDFDWLEKIIDNLYKDGIYTVLATPSGAKPLWMSEKYEEIRRVQNNGVRDLSGALSDQGVSIAQAIQKGQSEAGVPLVFMTHEASVSAIRKAVETMRKSDFLLAPAICYRVMG